MPVSQRIHSKALEDTALPEDFFYAAMGNLPFGNYLGFGFENATFRSRLKRSCPLSSSATIWPSTMVSFRRRGLPSELLRGSVQRTTADGGVGGAV